MIVERSKIEKYDIIYISPHIDDVGFSCPASLLDNKKERMLVITIFSHPNNPENKKYKQRFREEKKASQIGNYDYHLAAFLDAPFRNSKFCSFNGLAWGKDDEQLTKEVQNYIENIIDSTTPHTLIAPLGVGRHIDHRIAHQACYNIKKDCDIWYYEDRPYAFTKHSVNARLFELGYITEFSLEEFMKSFLETPYVNKFLRKEKQINICYENYQNMVKTAVPQKVLPQNRLKEYDNYDMLWELISSYSSQVGIFYKNKEVFVQLCQDYSSRFGAKNYRERQWKLENSGS